MTKRFVAVAGAAVLAALAASTVGLAETTAREAVTIAQNSEANKSAKAELSEAQKAQQQRMRDCGAKWQKAKADGTTDGKTWNQFRSECLKRKN